MKDIVIDGVVYAPKTETPKRDDLEYCIVRTESAGVFAGFFDRSNNGEQGTVFEARRLWYWSGAASLSQLALEGVKNPKECKFPAAVAEVDLRGICEVIPATAEAKASVDGVPVWQV